MNNNFTVKDNGKVVQLTQHNYKASGGEGAIFVVGGDVFKIYEDVSKMIPVGKIKELASLQIPNVLAPLCPITDMSDAPVGLKMRYAGDVEFLCKLFSRGFRDENNVDIATINAVVKRMQDTLKQIHAKGFLVVDYNELNFLTSRDFKEVWHIDVDSYKTPSYPPTALMASVADPKVTNKNFTVGSDWFSAAIIYSQLYLGTHPYKARHPDYGRNDWMKMMKDGVSIFNKASKMPPGTQDFSVVPKGHLKWLEKVLEHGERIAPPDPDAVQVLAGPVAPQIVNSTSRFGLQLVHSYPSRILALRYINGAPYVYTETGIYANHREVSKHSLRAGFTEKRTKYDFVAAQNDQPVVIEYNEFTKKLKYRSFSGALNNEIEVDSYFIANGLLYTVRNSRLGEHSFMNLGAKTIASQETVSDVFHSHTAYEGFVVQDILGTCRFAMPVKPGVVSEVRIPELDKARILGAKFERGTAIVIAERKGQFDRFVFCFDRSYKTYTIRKEEKAPLQDVQLVVMDKGVSVATNQDAVEIFADNSKVNLVDDSPFLNGQRLYTFGNAIYLTNNNEIHKVTLTK